MHLLGSLKKHCGGYIFQTDVKMHQDVSKWFDLQGPKLCAEGVHSWIKSCDKGMILQNYYVEK
jgi:hypothetical protein